MKRRQEKIANKVTVLMNGNDSLSTPLPPHTGNCKKQREKP